MAEIIVFMLAGVSLYLATRSKAQADISQAFGTLTGLPQPKPTVSNQPVPPQTINDGSLAAENKARAQSMLNSIAALPAIGVDMTRGILPNFAWKAPYDSLIFKTVAQQARVIPMPLVKAIMAQESSFDPNAIRSEPAARTIWGVGDESVGLMQLLTETARWCGKLKGTQSEIRQQLLRPEVNVSVAVRYLLYQFARYGSFSDPAAISKVIAAYNAGSAIMSKTSPGKFINQGYVDKVTRYMQMYKDDFPPIGDF